MCQHWSFILATSALAVQNWFETTLTSGVTASTTTIDLNALPTGAEGYLVIEPDSEANREVIYYTSKTGSAVVLPSVGAGRGQDGTSAVSHAAGATVRMQVVAAYWEALQDMTAVSAAVGNQQVITGVPVQVVGTDYAAVATGTTTIPLDDTIPQNTEGTEFMSQAITPKSTTNILYIEVVFRCSISSAQDIIIALFQDSTANALAATSVYQATASGRSILTLNYKMTAGTTSATTFKLRAGPQSSGTLTFNGTAATREFGAITKSSIRITEVKA